MIIERNVNGNKKTSYHNFILSQIGMTISISKGEYYRGDQTLLSSDMGTSFDVPVPTEDADYQVWLTTEGVHVYVSPANQPVNTDDPTKLIDKIAWFTVPSGTTSLDNVQVNALRMVLA